MPKSIVLCAAVMVYGLHFLVPEVFAQTTMLQTASQSNSVSQSVVAALTKARPDEHPLMPSLRWAEQGLPELEKVKDYSALFVKRERVAGVLGEPQYLRLKVRHEPFSVYAKFLAPASVKGEEVIYVEGQNEGKLLAHVPGFGTNLLGTVSVKPDSALAMCGQRHPMTKIGLLNMVRRLIEIGHQDIHYAECEVQNFHGAKINGQRCLCVQVVHPVQRSHFYYYLARIFIDEQTSLPVRYECYDWPKKAHGDPELMEQYTYLNVKFNNGFTDEEFDIKNPAYHFP